MSYADLRKHMIENQLRSLDADVHGGESLEAVAARVWEALDERLAVTQGPLLAVSHGFAIHAFVQRRLGQDFGLAEIANGDVIELWLDGAVAIGPAKRYRLD